MNKSELQPVLRGYARTVCDRSWIWHNRNGSKAEHVLWLIESGSGGITLDGEVQTVRSGECLLIPMWKNVDGEHLFPEPFVVLWAVFAMCDSDGVPVDLTGHRYAEYTYPLRRNLPDTEFFRHLFMRLLAGESDGERRDYLRALLRELRYQDSFVHTRGMEPEVYREIAAICAQIRNEPGKNWEVQSLAGGMHYSADHFSRVFKQATGERPQDFIISQRVATAKSMLVYSSSSISSIAASLGYCDVYHFCRQFKQKTGLTPLQQRRGVCAK